MFDFDREYSLEGSVLVRDAIFFFCFLFVVGLVANANKTLGGLLGLVWGALLLLRLLSIALLVLIPALRISGGIIVDFVNLVMAVYNMTVRPAINVGVFLYRLAAQQARKSSDAGFGSNPGSQGQEQASWGGSSEGRQSRQETEDERFQRRQEQRRRDEEETRRQKQKQQQGSSPSPWDVLGVPVGCDFETARRAYREQSKKYHPDRVHDLGAEFQEMAHKRFKEINEAWDKLQKQF